MASIRQRLHWFVVVGCIAATIPATAGDLRAVFDQLAVVVTPAGQDIYKCTVSPRMDRFTPGADTDVCRSEGGTTEMRVNNGWLEARRVDDQTGPSLWRGRVSPIGAFGRASIPGSRLEWNAPPGEAIYGLGQRFNGLNQAGKFVEMWIRDEPGQGAEGKASYFCTPVLFSSAGYAVFAADNPEGEFSLNPLGEGLNRYLRGGQAWTFYVALGPTLRDLVQKRIGIQGPIRGVPDWAWGPWISRNSYEHQGEAEDAIRGMVDRDIPVAVIVQEAWKGSSHTGDFNNFSGDRWPDVSGFFALCGKHGIRNVLWQVPIIHPTSPDFSDAERQGFFVRKPDGSVSWRREWLEGFANLDFTRPEAVRWWQDQMRDEVRLGVRGFKNDDGEDIKPDDVFADGRRGWQMHNEFSVLYAKALFALFDQEKVDGMLWGRSASLGCEQTPALWAGDQYATWAQYRSLLPAGLSSGLSGAPFWGHDIGGYIDQPTPELYIRWLQFGAFSPMMQYHGVLKREPWEFGKEAERAYKLLAGIRMNLRPTLKALGRAAVRTGLPIMRPMAMEFPDDPRFRDEDSQYMLGSDLLVAPVLEEGATGRRIKFPAGRWQHLLLPVAYSGPSDVVVPLDLVSAPVFVREGSALMVELAEGKELGSWKDGVTERALLFDASRAVLSDVSFPLSGSTLTGRATITFRVNTNSVRELSVFAAPRGKPDRRSPLPLVIDGDKATVELNYKGTHEADFVITVQGGGSHLFAGTMRWQSPVTIDTEVAGSRFVSGGERKIRARLVNHSDDALKIDLSATASGDITIGDSTRAIEIQPRGDWSGEWSLDIGTADGISDAVVRLVARADDRILGEESVHFARPLRMAVAGPFPAREKEAFTAPFPPEWELSPDVRFSTAEGIVRWTTLPADHHDHHDGIDFEALWGQRDHAAGYSAAKIRSRTSRDAELRVGADDTLSVWLNGNLIFAKEVYRLAAWDQEVIPLKLPAGDSTLVFKVAQDRNPWRLLVHLTGPQGSALVGVSDIFDAAAYSSGRRDDGPVVESPRPIAWQLAGPFPLENRDDKASPGRLDALASAPKPWPADITWRSASEVSDYSGTFDLNAFYGNQLYVDAYAYAEWNVSKPTPIVLQCGSDDGLVIWLNGRRIHTANKWRGFKRAEETVKATLQPGRNVLFCRIRQGDGAWKFRIDAWDVSSKPYRPLQ